jgi:fluoride exporter
MFAYFCVAVGGALGSVARFWISGAVARQWGQTFPWGTMAVNVTGSLLIGFLTALTEPGGRRFMGPAGTQFFMIGICGGYTTFSSFSRETFNLLRDREWLYAGGNVFGSVIACMLAVWLGYVLGVGFNSMKGN